MNITLNEKHFPVQAAQLLCMLNYYLIKFGMGGRGGAEARYLNLSAPIRM